MIRKVAYLISIVQILLLSVIEAKIPDAEIYLDDDIYLASYGNFGSRKRFDGLHITVPPTNDIKLCGNASTPISFAGNKSSIILVPRGDCSFQYKLNRALSLGAMGVIIYNTLESRYDKNAIDGSVVYPRPKLDYDCDPNSTLLFNPPFQLDPPLYNGTVHDKYLIEASRDNVCVLENCDSKRCLIAAKINNSTFQACCAWDIFVSMSSDNETVQNVGVAIFVTMAQADKLLEKVSSQVKLRIQPRYYPRFNWSGVITWALAVIIIAYASWNSASEYREARLKLSRPVSTLEAQNQVELTPTVVIVPPMESFQHPSLENVETRADQSSSHDDSNQELENGPRQQDTSETVISHPIHENGSNTTPQTNQTQRHPPSQFQESSNASQHQGASTSTPHTDSQTQRQPSRVSPGTVEINCFHAALFVLVSSGLLLVLFFFELYSAVTVLYGVGCSGALVHLIFQPLLCKFASLTQTTNFLQIRLFPKLVFCGLDEANVLDVFAYTAGYTVGAVWLYLYFTLNDPSENTFYWITQNIMGACICIVFLGILRLNSIKVAILLLTAVFIYDIFFVFLSPYFFGGESVMITVATSGGPADIGPDYCEKYPSDSRCRQGQPLPMLLTIPRVGDFRGGSSLLGLGDIILPGLLISFAARLDEAKWLVGTTTSLAVEMPLYSGGYLPYLILAYATGLLVANTAVVLMNQGQPALMYLVPATLGTFLFLGRHEWKDLWKGPRVLIWADRLVRYSNNPRFIPLRDAATVAESIEELDSLNGDAEESHEDTSSRQEFTYRRGTITSEQSGSTREVI
jgi:hypothetical protein